MFMGVGFVLAFGLACFCRFKYVFTVRFKWLHKLAFVFCLLATGLTGWGMINSQSRGAWIAVSLALFYLPHRIPAFLVCITSRSCSILKNSFFLVLLIIVSLTMVAFWQYRYSESLVVRRVFSVANLNDFSWRNRVIAWEGTLEMVADRPWFGFGWGNRTRIYSYYYQPTILGESGALLTNDYLMLGNICGVPILFFFLLYVWRSLTAKRSSCDRILLDIDDSDFKLRMDGAWLKTTCHAGAIVLLVGFWFDGGLFKLSTGSTFLILLELGMEDERQLVNEAKVINYGIH